MARPKSDKSDADKYVAKREAAAEQSRRQTEAGQDIGEIPPIANVKRRARCRKSLKAFCETYNRSAFSMAWSDDHLNAIARIEEAATLGALYALALPRGSGKTTLARMAALWVMSYAICRYTFVIGATDGKASDTLDSLKMLIRFGQPYSDDFPEIAFPVSKLRGSSRRTAGQTASGQPTLMEWSGDRIIFPTVPPPKSWPKSWKLRDDGMVPTSGGVIMTSGLTGEGIRGSLLTLSTGEMVRPDFVLLDDPQTNQSAGSRVQNATREQLVSADVLGMAGPGKSISAVMPCTVIAPGDFIDRVLNRTIHPLWRGERAGILGSLPKNLAAWDLYFEVFRRCAQKEPPDFTEANNHYIANQVELDEGADARWKARKLPGDVSAIQHAMNLYCRDRRAFMAEYMNQPEPLDVAGQLEDLDAGDIAAKVNGVPRGVVPRECTRLTAGIDVGGEVMWWCVVGWDERFGGSIVDYGTFPKQARSYFTARDVRPSLSDTWPAFKEESRVYAGLKATVEAVCGKSYRHESGGEISVSKALADSAKWTKEVTSFCRGAEKYRHILMPYRGHASLTTPVRRFKVNAAAGERMGDNWIEKPNTEGGYGRLVMADVNYWKSFVARALLTPEMGLGCMRLFGDDHHVHELFAEHCTAEKRTIPFRRTGDQSEVEMWQLRLGRPDNHWWDSLVMATVAASRDGLDWDSGAAIGDPRKPKGPAKPKVKMSDRFYAKNGGRS